MNLRTARLLIRDLRPDDAEALFAIYSDPEVRRFIGGEPTASIAQQREQLAATLERQSREEPGYGRWAIETAADGKVVGIVILKHPPGPDGQPTTDVEVGWHLGRFAWGNGYATEAAKAILDHAKDTLGLTRIYAIIRPENIRSIRVAERLGLEPRGITDRFYATSALHFAWSSDAAGPVAKIARRR